MRGTAFAQAEAAGGSAAVESSDGAASDLTTFVSQELTKSDRPELTAASKVRFSKSSLLSINPFYNLICSMDLTW